MDHDIFSNGVADWVTNWVGQLGRPTGVVRYSCNMGDVVRIEGEDGHGGLAVCWNYRSQSPLVFWKQVGVSLPHNSGHVQGNVK
jgi:hypothetical protein